MLQSDLLVRLFRIDSPSFKMVFLVLSTCDSSHTRVCLSVMSHPYVTRYVGAPNAEQNSTLAKLLTEQANAHTLIAAAESVLWPARRVRSTVAILAHRSSNAWDPSGTAKWENVTENTMG